MCETKKKLCQVKESSHQRPLSVWPHFYEVAGINRPIETECRSNGRMRQDGVCVWVELGERVVSENGKRC